MDYKIKNISRQVLSLEDGQLLLSGNSYEGSKTDFIKTFEQRGYVSCVPLSSANKKPSDLTEPEAGESATSNSGRVGTEDNEISPSVPQSTPVSDAPVNGTEKKSDSKTKN